MNALECVFSPSPECKRETQPSIRVSTGQRQGACIRSSRCRRTWCTSLGARTLCARDGQELDAMAHSSWDRWISNVRKLGPPPRLVCSACNWCSKIQRVLRDDRECLPMRVPLVPCARQPAAAGTIPSRHTCRNCWGLGTHLPELGDACTPLRTGPVSCCCWFPAWPRLV